MPSPVSFITRQRVEAYHASALRLLVRLLTAMLTGAWRGRSPRVRAAVTWLEKVVERVLFPHAVARAGPPPALRRPPQFAHCGFRRRRRNHRLFFRNSGVRLRKGGMIARVLRLLDVLARPERVTGYFLKRLLNGLQISGLVVRAPPATRLACVARSAPAFADSS